MIFKRLRRSVILLRSCCFLNSGYSQRVLLSSTFASRGVLTAQPRRLRASFKMAPPLSTLLRVRMLNMHPLTFLLPTTSRNQHPCEPSKDISQSSVGLNVAHSYLLGPKGNSLRRSTLKLPKVWPMEYFAGILQLGILCASAGIMLRCTQKHTKRFHKNVYKKNREFNVFTMFRLASGRWANLWTPASLVRRVTTLQTTRRLQETESSGRCELAEAGSDDIGAIVFIGNLALFAVILLTIFLFHVLLASGVEAYWLTKVTEPMYILRFT